MSYKKYKKYKKETQYKKDYIYIIENGYYEFPVKISNTKIITDQYKEYIKQDNIFSKLSFVEYWNRNNPSMPIDQWNAEHLKIEYDI